ncbi:hypothetical protein COCMIDRAFT_25284 [Bipolaris oryzae ATCC 44560]|uniref:Uncharacterized protein n=1 Tax=Bipolaris oryzae ATCC 44560 TaxID=930090 RepID=W6Z4M2_COCMI|nr:uncharacterized protein COCMIDRAFT_25284 [Bipolaris oryzae ATCC 44560]EUC46682.1 hypothetical protein COCMIDRAFT_25284 [Bipolaris oryzae ATCC 44560]
MVLSWCWLRFVDVEVVTSIKKVTYTFTFTASAAIKPDCNAKTHIRTIQQKPGPPQQHTSRMSFFPIIPSVSLYSSILAPSPAHHHYHEQIAAHHATHMDHHALTSFLSHLLAPVSHNQCTSSAPCSTPPPLSESCPPQKTCKEPHIIRLAEEEELARLQHGEQDGTPLCREGDIEVWHQQPHPHPHQNEGRRDSMEAAKKSRRGSLEWLAGAIRERRVHV